MFFFVLLEIFWCLLDIEKNGSLCSCICNSLLTNNEGEHGPICCCK